MLKRKRHWLRIGVELEGGWDIDPHKLLGRNPLFDVKTDGSVNVPGVKYNGEVTVGPYDKLDRALAAISRAYPEKVNYTCGLHVHLSFRPEDALRMACKGFWKHVKDFWVRWGEKSAAPPEFWQRLCNGTEYCEWDLPWYYVFERPIWTPYHYQAINFSSWKEHGTIEFRFLPMFHDSAVAVKSVAAMVECVESYLGNPDKAGDRAPVVTMQQLGKPGSSSTKTKQLSRQKHQQFKRGRRAQLLLREGGNRAGCYTPF